MKKLIIAAAFMMLAGSASGQDWHKAGTNPNDYEMLIVSDVKYRGTSSAKIISLKDSIDGFGTYMQTFKADKYHGKKIRLSAWIKTENANSVQMWMRFDGKENFVGFDNMDDRPIKGTTDWKQYSIVLDVPKETVFIAFGTFVHGTGTAWIDDYAFEIADKKTPSTGMHSNQDDQEDQDEQAKAQWVEYINMNYPSEPMNLGFEK